VKHPVYGRQKELYKKHPGLPAKYIREGTDWLEDINDSLNNTDIKSYYTTLG
jgi:hypothetical protein